MTAASLGIAVTLLTAQGRTAREIAEQLGCTRRTVVRWRARHLTVPVTAPIGWLAKAECRSHNPAWFVPPEDMPPSYARGKAVCMRCPVRDACLNDALTKEGHAPAEDRAGLWGGMSPEQRANIAAVRTPLRKRRNARTRAAVEEAAA